MFAVQYVHYAERVGFRVVLCRLVPPTHLLCGFPRIVFIYFDESGIFANPQGRDQAVSCVVALAVPERRRRRLFLEFRRLKSKWNAPGEIKGSKLSEGQVASVIELLLRHEAVAEILAIDMAFHDDSGVTSHKMEQARRLVANLSDEHTDTLIAQVYELKERLESLSSQLYVQSVLTTEAVGAVLQTSTLYYSLRFPAELGSFRWVFDAKGHRLTPAEELWQTIVLPLVESRSLSKPLISISDNGDYTHFERYALQEDAPPSRLADKVDLDDGVFHGVDLTSVFRDRAFLDSKSNLGLQLVDIVANSFRRALTGKLQFSGWSRLGRLLISHTGGSVHFIALSQISDSDTVTVGYADVLEHINASARSLWPSHLRQAT